jgi:hypothetical protein
MQPRNGFAANILVTNFEMLIDNKETRPSYPRVDSRSVDSRINYFRENRLQSLSPFFTLISRSGKRVRKRNYYANRLQSKHFYKKVSIRSFEANSIGANHSIIRTVNGWRFARILLSRNVRQLLYVFCFFYILLPTVVRYTQIFH